MEKKWRAVYTRAGFEKKVVEMLNRKKIDNYCPLSKVICQDNSKSKMMFQPLFTSCVFVKITEQEQGVLKKVKGVINLMYWLEDPIIIKEEEIQIIKQFLNEYDNVFIERIPVNIEGNAQITVGAFTEEGNVITFESNTIKALFPSLGFSMVTKTEKLKVDVITLNTLTEAQTVYN